MGGGAGISFDSTKESFTIRITEDENNNRKLKAEFIYKPILESFNMKGYNDGMSNIRGDILIPETDIAFSYFNDLANINNIYNDYKLYNVKVINIYGYVKLDDMLFGGYVRGDISIDTLIDTDLEIDELEIVYSDGNVVYSEYGDKLFELFEKNLGIEYRATQDFINCYNDIFPNNIDDFEYISDTWKYISK